MVYSTTLGYLEVKVCVKPKSPPLAEHCLARKSVLPRCADHSGAKAECADPVTENGTQDKSVSL